MRCPICSSSNRHQIEVDLLSGDSPEIVMSRGYGKFSLDELRLHAVSHMDIRASEGESIATKLAFKEAETLTRVHSEYMATLRRVGQVISDQLDLVSDGSVTIAQALSKSTVDLYLGTGNQIRETVKLLTETYADMNADDGERDNKSSINKLVMAIHNSKENRTA